MVCCYFAYASFVIAAEHRAIFEAQQAVSYKLLALEDFEVVQIMTKWLQYARLDSFTEDDLDMLCTLSFR